MKSSQKYQITKANKTNQVLLLSYNDAQTQFYGLNEQLKALSDSKAETNSPPKVSILSQALAKGDDFLLDLLIEKHTKFNANHLVRLIRLNKFDAVKKILQNKLYTGNTVTDDNEVPLTVISSAILTNMKAVGRINTDYPVLEKNTHNLFELLKKFIEAGDNLNIFDNNFHTPLTILSLSLRKIKSFSKMRENGLQDTLNDVFSEIMKRHEDIDEYILGMSKAMYILNNFRDRFDEFENVLSLDEVEIEPIYKFLRMNDTKALKEKLRDGFIIPEPVLSKILEVNSTEVNKLIVKNAKNQKPFFKSKLLEHAVKTQDFSLITSLFLDGHKDLQPFISISHIPDNTLLNLFINDELDLTNSELDTFLDKLGFSTIIEQLIAYNSEELELPNINVHQFSHEEISVFLTKAITRKIFYNADKISNWTSRIDQIVDTLNLYTQEDVQEKTIYDMIREQLDYFKLKLIENIKIADTNCLYLMELIPENIPFEDYKSAVDNGRFKINNNAYLKYEELIKNNPSLLKPGAGISNLIRSYNDSELAAIFYAKKFMCDTVKQMYNCGLFSKVNADKLESFFKVYHIAAKMIDLGVQYGSSETEFNTNEYQQLKYNTEEIKDNSTVDIMSSLMLSVNDTDSGVLAIGECHEPNTDSE